MRFPGVGGGSRTGQTILQQSAQTDEQAANKQRAKEARQQALIQIGGIGANLAGDFMRMYPQLQAIQERERTAQADRAFQDAMSTKEFGYDTSLLGQRGKQDMGIEEYRAGQDTIGREFAAKLAEEERAAKELAERQGYVEKLRLLEELGRQAQGLATQDENFQRWKTTEEIKGQQAAMPSPLNKSLAELKAPIMLEEAQTATEDMPLDERLRGQEQILMGGPEGQALLMAAEDRKQFGRAAQAIGKKDSDLYMAERGEPGFFADLSREEAMNMIASLLIQDEKGAQPRIGRMMEGMGGQLPEYPPIPNPTSPSFFMNPFTMRQQLGAQGELESQLMQQGTGEPMQLSPQARKYFLRKLDYSNR